MTLGRKRERFTISRLAHAARAERPESFPTMGRNRLLPAGCWDVLAGRLLRGTLLGSNPQTVHHPKYCLR